MRLHLHFLHRPVQVLGSDRVTGLRFERTEFDGAGGVRGTGLFTEHPVEAVYRAVGYPGSQLDGLLFDHDALRLDKRERRAGEERGRERMKVVPRAEMLAISRTT